MEHILFRAAALGPVSWITQRALGHLGERSTRLPKDDEALAALWESAVSHSHLQFLHGVGGEALEPDLEAFEQQCARCFGVDDDLAAELIRLFHQAPRKDRFGIFIAIESNPNFSYLTREIDRFGGEGAEASAPTPSLRRLVALVVNRDQGAQ